MKEKYILLLSYITLITILKESLQYTDDSICPNLKCSSSGICVDNYSQCPTPMNCGNDLKKVNQYTCAKLDTILEVKKCKKYTCWNNECVEDTKLCPTMSNCPSKAVVKCHDNSCVDNISNCPKYMTCPKFIPIRCPNGDCRRSLEDCPSLIKCPKDFPILCNDNSCRITAEECEKPAENTKCSGSSMVRCTDGTCKSSKFLCATAKTCPIKKTLCFNGICADSYEQCEKTIMPDRSNTCGAKGLVRCDYDGSCRSDINDCPTAIICPVEKPVKCWDNSCKENINNCPEFQTCPKNRNECGNGTCRIPLKTCGTLITCSWDAPFKCKDNTCKRNPNDCDDSDQCPVNKPILCWDGSCVAIRIDCIVPEACHFNMPVRCPDNQCRKSVEECKEITGCPVGFIRCADLTCNRKSSDCKKITCPQNFANMCSNGVCVKDAFECEKSNGCPFYASEKCKNGKCVSDKNQCEEIKVENADLQICDDGSQILKSLSCPLSNGCPQNKPILCGNGECRLSCKFATCPKETPVKCLNGLCVISQSNCPSNYNFNSIKECTEKNLISCANGICSRFSEECKPASACSTDLIKCGDGTCRYNASECPKFAGCPDNKFRCTNGACENSENECLNFSGCPKNKKVKCVSNGLCVESQEDCAAYDKKFSLANGCDIDKPYKCPNSGKCAVDKDNCEESLCEGKKIFCTNSGVCKDSIRECRKSFCDGFICLTNGLCVKKVEECKTLKACDPKTPYRCLDGQCRKFPFTFGSKSESQFCSLRIECPSYRPYLCADGSCMEKSSFCKSLSECPADAKVRCSDRTCAKSLEDCGKFLVSDNCPATNPILCSKNGNCVKNFFDCFEEKCPEEFPVKCISGICVSSPRECVYDLTNINDIKNKTNINENTLLVTKTKCETTDKTCFDGSCRDDISLCPVFEGCNDLDFPFKCSSGKCAKYKKGCSLDSYNNPIIFSELINIKCENKLKLCDDGICRNNCPVSNSCTNDNPYLCTNGRCVIDINECAGESKCEIGKPFRCVDGTCVSEPSLCRKPKKLESSTDLKLFVFPEQDLISDIIIDDSNDIIGNIYIPSKVFWQRKTNVIKINNLNNDTDRLNINSTVSVDKPSKQIISIRSLAVRDSKLASTTKNFDDSVRDIVNTLFPYGDEKDQLKLEFEYAILSPVLEINFEIEKSIIKQDIILILKYDLQKFQMYSGEVLQKVCLAYLAFENSNSTEWECTRKINKESDINKEEIEGVVEKPGYYAIALDLKINEDIKSKKQDWILENLKWFIMLICTGLLLMFVFIYIFLRILRYRKKYIKTKIDYIEMEKKEASIKEKSTSFRGQTIRDTEDNVVFTDNPCKEERLNQNNESKKIRMDYLKSVEDSYFHKIKVSEANNEKLVNELDAAYERYEKLKEYSELLRQGKNLFSENE